MKSGKILSVALVTSSLGLPLSSCFAEADDIAPLRLSPADIFAPQDAKATTLSQAGFWTAWKLDDGDPPAVGLTTRMLDGSVVRIEYVGASTMFIDVSQPKWETLPESDVRASIAFGDDVTDNWSTDIVTAGHGGYLEGVPTIRLDVPQDRMFNDFLSKIIKGGSGKMKIRFAVNLSDVWTWYANLDGADVAGAAFVKAAAEMDKGARERRDGK